MAYVSQTARTIMRLQGRWGTYGSYADVASSLLVTIGGLYMVQQSAQCTDSTFRMESRKFIQATYVYFAVSLMLPWFYNKFLAGLDDKASNVTSVANFIAEQFVVKLIALVTLAWLFYKAWQKRTLCRTRLNITQLVKTKLSL
jgi:hypothetical protein